MSRPSPARPFRVPRRAAARRFAAPLPALAVALVVAPVVTFVAGPSAAAEEAPADVRAVERAMVPMRLSVPMGEGGTPYELEGFAYPEPVTVLRDGVPTAAGGADDPFVRFAREMLAATLSADMARTLALWRPDADAEEIALVRGTLGGDLLFATPKDVRDAIDAAR